MRTPPRSAGSPRAWLGTVLRNLARTGARRGGRRERHESTAAAAPPPFVASPADVVADGGEASVVVPVTKAAVIAFQFAAASPTSIVVYEVAQGDGPWRLVMRTGGLKGG